MVGAVEDQLQDMKGGEETGDARKAVVAMAVFVAMAVVAAVRWAAPVSAGTRPPARRIFPLGWLLHLVL